MAVISQKKRLCLAGFPHLPSPHQLGRDGLLVRADRPRGQIKVHASREARCALTILRIFFCFSYYSSIQEVIEREQRQRLSHDQELCRLLSALIQNYVVQKFLCLKKIVRVSLCR